MEVNYKICFGNATCQKGVISVFGNPGATVQENLPINSEHFVILEDTVRIILYKKINGQYQVHSRFEFQGPYKI